MDHEHAYVTEDVYYYDTVPETRKIKRRCDCGNKTFSWSTKRNEYWRRGVEDVMLVPYGIRSALEAQDLIYVVEGERDVDSILKHGAYAVSSPNGAGSWLDLYSR